MLRGVLHRTCSCQARIVRASSTLTPASAQDKAQHASVVFKKQGGKLSLHPGAASRIPKQDEIHPNEVLPHDQVTHTGQSWDSSDYRMARFTYRDKQVNPNVAAHLVSEIAPVEVNARIVSCDGGGGALGHPKVYINLDKPGNHICGYCGLRYTKAGQQNPGVDHPGVIPGQILRRCRRDMVPNSIRHHLHQSVVAISTTACNGALMKRQVTIKRDNDESITMIVSRVQSADPINDQPVNSRMEAAVATLAKRQPLIKFPDRSNQGTHFDAAKQLEIVKTSISGGGGHQFVIDDDRMIPPRFRRKLLDQDEIDAINNGGQYP